MTSSLAAELAIEDGSVDASPCIVFLILISAMAWLDLCGDPALKLVA
jgi:hypothetical protein